MLLGKWLMGEESSLNTLSISAQEYVQESKIVPFRRGGADSFKKLPSFNASKKKEDTISTNNFSAEQAFSLLCEYDDSVFGYYDQPQSIMIKKTDKNGVLGLESYTPDFLIETKSGVYVIEVKSLSQINKLIEIDPNNWKKISCSNYEHKPVKDAFKKLGIRYRLWVYQDEYRYKIANISILLASRNAGNSSENIQHKIDGLFEEAFYWLLQDLADFFDESSFNNIIQLIDRKVIYADLNNSLLSDPGDCVVVNSRYLLSTAIKLNAVNK